MKKKAGIEDYPMAVVREVNGQLVLDDPDARAVIAGIGKAQCKDTFDLNKDRVEHFKQRFVERGFTADSVVIAILNVDDPNGELIADILMPGTDWQAIRDQGMTPFARGLAARKFIQEALELFDALAAEKLKAVHSLAVVVVDHNVAEIFEV